MHAARGVVQRCGGKMGMVWWYTCVRIVGTTLSSIATRGIRQNAKFGYFYKHTCVSMVGPNSKNILTSCGDIVPGPLYCW